MDGRRFRVTPDYCNPLPNDDPYELSAEELHEFLCEELSYGSDPMERPRPNLDQLLAMGGVSTGGRLSFDVTRPGCRQSAIHVTELPAGRDRE